MATGMPATPHPRHLPARRHLQGRVLPPRRPARGCARSRRRARRAADARHRQPRPLRQAHRRHGRRDLEHQQVRDHLQERAARSRRRLSVRPGVHRHCLRRLERQLRQPAAAVGPFAIANGFIDKARIPENGTFTVRIWQANIGKTIVCARADREWPGAGNRRLRTRWRDLSGGRDRARVHRPGRRGRRRGRRRDVPDRQSGRHARGAWRRHAHGDDDQRRHPDDLRQRQRHRLHRHRAAGRHQRRPEGTGACSRPSAPTARCAWA